MAAALRPHLESLPHAERSQELGTFFDRLGDAEIVLLDEGMANREDGPPGSGRWSLRSRSSG